MTKSQIQKLGYEFYGLEEVLKTAPKVKGEIEYFKTVKYITPQELQDEYDKRGLIPAPVEDILDESKDYVATQWKDAEGNWCCATFSRWDDKREVDVHRGDYDWYDFWCFAGVRKSSQLKNSDLSSDTLPLVLEINGVKYKRI